jgi:membrane peptidoglycan carboxypeptidase
MKNPVRYDPFKKSENFRSRYIHLIATLQSEGRVSGEQAQSLSGDIDTLDRRKDTAPAQPYIRDYIQQQAIKQGKPLPATIYTTIDDNLSREIKTIADQTIYKLLWKDVSDYGVLVIDRQSNELRVMLGGMAYDGIAGQVNSTLSINQPGSAVKPFTYALAFQNLGIRPSDTIIDEPVQFQSLL